MEPITGKALIVRPPDPSPPALKWWQGWRLEYDYGVVLPAVVMALVALGRLT